MKHEVGGAAVMGLGEEECPPGPSLTPSFDGHMFAMRHICFYK